jgi:3-dehydroquinate dehydratase/shikimate dehydrogenase
MKLYGCEKICAVIAERTADAAFARMGTALKQTRLTELRLDYFAGRREALQFLRLLRAELARNTKVLCIATCRHKTAGGRFGGSLAEQLALLRLAVDCGCQWVDVEIETATLVHRGALRRWLAPAKWILSWHTFRPSSPGPFEHTAIRRALNRHGADVYKIGVQLSCLREAARLLAIPRKNRDTIVVPMGKVVAPARILALRKGSPLAYASTGDATAPGQFSLDEMRQLYRAAEISRKTRVYGVIGNPVAHSLSPVLHNAGFRARRVDAVLFPFLVNDLNDFCASVEPLGIAGFGVTLPHKERILRHLDGCDLLAEAIGAVNTVVVRADGRLFGYNTDYVGVLRALNLKMTLAGSRVLILGAGGVARATAFALSRAGASVEICARRPRRALLLARTVGGHALARNALRLEWFDAIINATPVGMIPDASASPLRANELNCRLVLDLVYRPLSTRLLQMAAKRGITCVSGEEIFLEQGMAQWEIWMGQRAPVAAMRKALRVAPQ